ncbi:hypothetical protein [Motilibacter deserti]|uniref:Uncharacterized protein n=1 Tax=Motilibacter deserti TaxID=2714956 RepID=A0ABX0GUH3_9ACTN|nr:hypothetical protein [Motilibacter deserti]NHC14562.1 hypothetical protein [Motilibacter deserti]
MVNDVAGTQSGRRPYVAPELAMVGTLEKLTAASNAGARTDVPLNTPVPPFSIFS